MVVSLFIVETHYVGRPFDWDRLHSATVRWKVGFAAVMVTIVIKEGGEARV